MNETIGCFRHKKALTKKLDRMYPFFHLVCCLRYPFIVSGTSVWTTAVGVYTVSHATSVCAVSPRSSESSYWAIDSNSFLDNGVISCFPQDVAMVYEVKSLSSLFCTVALTQYGMKLAIASRRYAAKQPEQHKTVPKVLSVVLWMLKA